MFDFIFFGFYFLLHPYLCSPIYFTFGSVVYPQYTKLFLCTCTCTVITIGFNQTSYIVIEGTDKVATVYVAVLDGRLQRSVSVTFLTEVLSSDTASGELFVVNMLKSYMICINIVSYTSVVHTRHSYTL